MDIKLITFYFPYHEVSGVSVLFSNLSNYIAQNFPIEIYIIDYKDGYMAKNIESSKIHLIEFKTGVLLHIDAEILIIQSILPYAMRPELQISNQTKIFFWNLHPDNFYPLIFPFQWIPNITKRYINLYKNILNVFWRKDLKRMKSFLHLAYDQNSLYFMDSMNRNMTNFIYDLNLDNKNTLPIACSDSKTNTDRLKSKKAVRFSWIGRICNFKIHILIYLCKCLSSIAQTHKTRIEIDIIGDGELKDILTGSLNKNDYFDFFLIGTIEKKSLDKYLIDNIDVNASMGTAALESAKLGIPTILLDYSDNPIKGDYKFRWLHDTTDFELGHNITFNDIEDGNNSLWEMIKSLKENPVKIGEKSVNYYKNNHSLNAVSKLFLVAVEHSNLLFGDIDKKLIQKGVIRKVYERKKYGI